MPPLSYGFLPDRNVIEIRWIEVDGISDKDWPNLRSMLSDEERARADRFHFDHDRAVYVAGHALVRAMLSAVVSKAQETGGFTGNDFGKPEAIMPTGSPKLRVNLSHTRGMAAVALGLDLDLGIDVETRKRTLLTLDLADRYFAPAEVALLKRLPASELNEALFSLWTLKEAFIKAVGKGLSIPLDSFAFNLDPEAFSLDDGNPEEWFFMRLKPVQDYAMAVALRHPEPASVRVNAQAVSAASLFGNFAMY